MEDFKATQKLSFQHKIFKINEIIAHSKPMKTNPNDNKTFFYLKERKIIEKVKMHFFEENKGEEIHLIYDDTVEKIRNGEKRGEDEEKAKELGIDKRREITISHPKKIVVNIILSYITAIGSFIRMIVKIKYFDL